MQREGFVRPSGPGKATRGWIHPQLKLGFECVSDVLLDGMADREMVQIVSLAPHGDIAVIAPRTSSPIVWANTPPAARRTCTSRRGRCSDFAKDWTCPIWNGGFPRKRQAAMAFKTLKTKREPIALEALGRRIAARKAELGLPDPPRNAGQNRTPSKRALLKAIEDAGGKW
jgi:hypothetical protein